MHVLFSKGTFPWLLIVLKAHKGKTHEFSSLLQVLVYSKCECYKLENDGKIIFKRKCLFLRIIVRWSLKKRSIIRWKKSWPHISFLIFACIPLVFAFLFYFLFYFFVCIILAFLLFYFRNKYQNPDHISFLLVVAGVWTLNLTYIMYCS